MKMKPLKHKSHGSIRTPLWKWLLIILLVVAMPLFFSLVRDTQLQQALISSTPEPQQSIPTQPEKHNNH